jgi:hypothetical protein
VTNPTSTEASATGPAAAGLRDFLNDGLQVIRADSRPPRAAGSRCIAVLGVARGGTSAVAACLSVFGVNMGRGALAPVYEDLELALAFESGDGSRARKMIEQRRQAGGTWGFKRPGYIRYAKDYHADLGDVRYVAVFRDPMATAMRARLSSQADLLDSMERSLREYAEIQAFLESCDAPALLVSYEKILGDPARFVEVLADFSELNAGERVKGAAAASLRASPVDYLDHTRSNKSRGRIDIVEATRIRGWAQYLTHRRQADIRILVNDEEVARAQADRYREDLEAMGISGDGCCAFDVRLDRALTPGDSVRVLVTDDPLDITNSPFIFRPPAERGLMRRLAAAATRWLKPRQAQPNSAPTAGLPASLEDMLNTGIATMVSDACREREQKTLVVLGTARGGTSAIAGALDRLGVFTGALSAGPVFEDVNLSAAIENGSPGQASGIIDDYNAMHPIWAYKRPRLLYHIQDVHTQFRNPVYLVIFRDVFAAAQRTAISGGVNLFLSMKKLLGDNGRILAFLRSERPNAILVSYEKLLARPDLLVDEVLALLGRADDGSARRAAIDFIRPAPEDYLDATRTNKASGAVTGISHNRVQGWAKYNFPLKPAAVVELSLNDRPVASVTADHPASDQLACEQVVAELPTDSRCVFRFDLEDHAIRAGDCISVKVSEDIAALENCPVTAALPATPGREAESL